MQVAAESRPRAESAGGKIDTWQSLARLAETRKRLGVTRAHLAQLAGLDVGTVKRAETDLSRLEHLAHEAIRKAVGRLMLQMQKARRWLARNAAVMFAQDGPTLPAASGWRPQSRLYCWTLVLLRTHALCAGSALLLLREVNGKHSPAVPEEWLREAVDDAAYARLHLEGWGEAKGRRAGR